MTIYWASYLDHAGGNLFGTADMLGSDKAGPLWPLLGDITNSTPWKQPSELWLPLAIVSIKQRSQALHSAEVSISTLSY